jgi:hypothetical protein
MTLEQIFQVSQIAAALGVIASLIFVGLQVRDNAKAVRSAAAQAVQDNYSHFFTALASNPSALATHLKGLTDLHSLTDVEMAQFVAISMAYLSNAQNAFHQWNEGHLADELWSCWEALTMNLVKTPGGAAFWRERSYIFGPQFQREVKSIMSREPDPGAKSWGVVPLTVTHRENPPAI